MNKNTMMKKIICRLNKLLVVMVCLGCLSCTNQETKSSDYDYLYEDLPFDMPVLSPPTFPNNEVLLTDFGGVGDGTTLNTKAFAAAMATDRKSTRLNSSH